MATLTDLARLQSKLRELSLLVEDAKIDNVAWKRR